MGIFDKVDNSAQTEQEQDRVRGQRQEPMPSDIQNLIIKHCYGQPSKGGALGVHTLFEVADGDHKGRQFKIVEYITSGDAKGNKTYYEKKSSDGKIERRNLPGFILIDSMAQLIAGKSIVNCVAEKRTIKLYDFDKKAEVPTEVEMFTELVNKGITACVVFQVQDKTAKDTQTGEYKPTGQTFSKNSVEKFLDPRSRKTLSEKKNDLSADFKDQWLKKWQGQVDDQSSEVKGAGMKGAPAPSGEQAEKAPLFAD